MIDWFIVILKDVITKGSQEKKKKETSGKGGAKSIELPLCKELASTIKFMSTVD